MRRSVVVRIIGVIDALGPKANAEDAVNINGKTVFLYLQNIKSPRSDWTMGVIVVGS